MAISQKRRITIIVISVSIGTMMSYMLLLGRKGKLDITDYSTLVFNSLLALLVIFGVGYILRKNKGDKFQTKK